MNSFTRRRNHEVISVQDTNENTRRICRCQVKDKHISDGQVEFPVFECPELTKRMGFGTEEGI